MKTDYVFPMHNESKFIRNAELLGYKQLFLIYEYTKGFDYKKYSQEIARLNKKSKVILLLGLIADSKDVQKALNMTKFVFVNAIDESSIRKIVEKSRPYAVFNLEYQKKDFIHHKNSGLNQITCRLLKQNKISLGFSFSFLLHSNNRQFLIGRMMQNICFARKFRFAAKIGSFATHPDDMRSPPDLKSFFMTLGMHPKEAEEALNL